jgi:hypothetical protein
LGAIKVRLAAFFVVLRLTELFRVGRFRVDCFFFARFLLAIIPPAG